MTSLFEYKGFTRDSLRERWVTLDQVWDLPWTCYDETRAVSDRLNPRHLI